MDATTHTIIAVAMLMGSYYAGRYFSKRDILEGIISNMLDHLEKDGYVSVKKDSVTGEKELIKIVDLVKESS
jgi:hypothetical protein